MLPILIGLGIAALAAIVIALLNWDRIKGFIRKVKEKLGLRVSLDAQDKESVAAQIKEARASGDCNMVNMGLFAPIEDTTLTATIHTIADNGKHETIYGVFSRSGEVIEAERVQSKKIDDTIQNLHRTSEIVIHY